MNAFEDLSTTDATLDAIGRGEKPVTDDLLLLALAEWRADADDPSPADGVLVAWRLAPPRRRRLLVAVAAGLVLVAGAGGVAAAAGDARPGSVLWPVTRLAYADRAESALAEQAAERSLTTAGQDLAAGRADQAQVHLAEAERQLGKVDSTEAARRLRERLAVLWAQAGAGPSPVPGGRSGTPVATPSPGGGGAGSTGKSADKRKPSTPEPSEHGGDGERSKGPVTTPTTKRPGEH
ncbi:hypothetical protein Lfu02_59310 [Longispora fulva]|uniref:Anti-sigma-D factor RsdA sigma factor binding region domain-containing protein n=1 Tax=Longispora fulva TaxID=619741 RepID=A0A8J7KWZ3_9ACTN|nr:hypothetical protein [Longispora fulva]MBG6137087.1 hypothetical protein [Longispora fulva]GIG61559.1 hypothetical protein Lfu02_59310 [Longispora fulva]